MDYFLELIGSHDANLTLIMLFRLLLAGILGAMIGFDRAYHAKEAGLRTHFLVAMGSSLFMIVSQHGFQDALLAGYGLDVSRVAAQIVSGIGFLGAGSIIFQKAGVRGLTTSAGLWTVAGIGMAVGGGLYLPAVAGTVMTFIALAVFKRFFPALQVENVKLNFSFAPGYVQQPAAVLDILKKHNCKVLAYSFKNKKAERRMTVTVSISKSNITEETLFLELGSIEGISLEKFE